MISYLSFILEIYFCYASHSALQASESSGSNLCFGWELDQHEVLFILCFSPVSCRAVFLKVSFDTLVVLLAELHSLSLDGEGGVSTVQTLLQRYTGTVSLSQKSSDFFLKSPTVSSRLESLVCIFPPETAGFHHHLEVTVLAALPPTV